jgi:ABC-type arginine transport system permease subunit
LLERITVNFAVEEVPDICLVFWLLLGRKQLLFRLSCGLQCGSEVELVAFIESVQCLSLGRTF